MIGNLTGELTKNEASHENGHSTRCTVAGLAVADHMYRLASSKSAPAPKGKAPGEIRGETIALTAVLC
jgi:hypothetical protein